MLLTKDLSFVNQKINPFNVTSPIIIKEDFYIPDNKSIANQPSGLQRRFMQNGFFTISDNKNMLNQIGILESILIENEFKSPLKQELTSRSKTQKELLPCNSYIDAKTILLNKLLIKKYCLKLKAKKIRNSLNLFKNKF